MFLDREKSAVLAEIIMLKNFCSDIYHCIQYRYEVYYVKININSKIKCYVTY